MKMAIEVIGSGGAFDTDKLNSSFLVRFEDKCALIDCGYNVFDYVKTNNIDVEDILITHTHFDHIGSLESLIYYNYFVKGKTTTIWSGPKVIEKLKLIFDDVNQIYENGQILPAKIVEFETLKNYNQSLGIYAIETNHIVTPSYGFVFNTDKKTIIVSGDTKASKNIMDVIDIECQNGKEVVVFHDYSEWNDPLRNIHCCKADFDAYYGPLLEKYKNLKFIFYHNNANVGHKEIFEI